MAQITDTIFEREADEELDQFIRKLRWRASETNDPHYIVHAIARMQELLATTLPEAALHVAIIGHIDGGELEIVTYEGLTVHQARHAFLHTRVAAEPVTNEIYLDYVLTSATPITVANS